MYDSLSRRGWILFVTIKMDNFIKFHLKLLLKEEDPGKKINP